MAVRQYVNKGSRCRRSAAHNTHRNFLDSQAMVEHNWNMKNIEQAYWKRWVRWLTTAPKKVNECEQKLSWGKAEMPLTPARQTQGDHNKTVRSHLCSNQMEVDLRIRPVQTGETERANQKADVIATHFYNDLSIACPSTCGVPPKYIWCPMNFKWWQWLQRRKNFRAKTKRRRWRMDFIDTANPFKATFANGVLALLLLQVKVWSCKCSAWHIF